MFHVDLGRAMRLYAASIYIYICVCIYIYIYIYIYFS